MFLSNAPQSASGSSLTTLCSRTTKRFPEESAASNPFETTLSFMAPRHSTRQRAWQRGETRLRCSRRDFPYHLSPAEGLRPFFASEDTTIVAKKRLECRTVGCASQSNPLSMWIIQSLNSWGLFDRVDIQSSIVYILPKNDCFLPITSLTGTVCR